MYFGTFKSFQNSYDELYLSGLACGFSVQDGGSTNVLQGLSGIKVNECPICHLDLQTPSPETIVFRESQFEYESSQTFSSVFQTFNLTWCPIIDWKCDLMIQINGQFEFCGDNGSLIFKGRVDSSNMTSTKLFKVGWGFSQGTFALQCVYRGLQYNGLSDSDLAQLSGSFLVDSQCPSTITVFDLPGFNNKIQAQICDQAGNNTLELTQFRGLLESMTGSCGANLMDIQYEITFVNSSIGSSNPIRYSAADCTSNDIVCRRTVTFDTTHEQLITFRFRAFTTNSNMVIKFLETTVKIEILCRQNFDIRIKERFAQQFIQVNQGNFTVDLAQINSQFDIVESCSQQTYIFPYFVTYQFNFMSGIYSVIPINNSSLSLIEAVSEAARLAAQSNATGFFYQRKQDGTQKVGIFQSSVDIVGPMTQQAQISGAVGRFDIDVRADSEKAILHDQINSLAICGITDFQIDTFRSEPQYRFRKVPDPQSQTNDSQVVVDTFLEYHSQADYFYLNLTEFRVGQIQLNPRYWIGIDFWLDKSNIQEWAPFFETTLQNQVFIFDKNDLSLEFVIKVPNRIDPDPNLSFYWSQVMMSIYSDNFGTLEVDNSREEYTNGQMNFNDATGDLRLQITDENIDTVIGTDNFTFVLKKRNDFAFSNTYDIQVDVQEKQEVQIQEVKKAITETKGDCFNENKQKDSQGNTCKWYVNQEFLCGSFDTKDFKAQDLCCGCKNVYVVKNFETETKPLPQLQEILMNERLQVTFKFSDTLWQPSNQILKDHFDEQIFKITILSVIDGSSYMGLRDAFDESVPSTYSSTNLRFSWKLDQKIGDTIKIQLNFEDPTSISSTAYGQDELYVKMEGSVFLRSQESLDQMVDPESLTLVQKFRLKPVSNQGIEINSVNSLKGAIKASIGGSTATSIALNIFLQKSIQDVWGMINTQQLIVHLGMVDVPVTGDALKFLEFMGELTQKDMYPTDKIYPQLFSFSETKSYNFRFQYIGYEGINFIELSGSALINISVGIQYALLSVSMIMACKALFKYSIFRMIAVKLSNQSSLAAILRIYLTTYLEFMISGLIWAVGNSSAKNYFEDFEEESTQPRQLIQLNQRTSDMFSHCFATVTIFILFALPIMIIKLSNSRAKAKSEEQIESLKKFDFLFVDIDTRSKFHLMYQAIFLSRRAFYAIVVICLTPVPVVQLNLHILSTVAYISYMLRVQPFMLRKSNWLEIFNEVCTLMASYCFYLFLDVSLSSTQREIIGKTFIYTVLFVFIFNLLNVMLGIFLVQIPEAIWKISTHPQIKEFEQKKQMEKDRLQKLVRSNPLDELIHLQLKYFQRCLEYENKVKKIKDQKSAIKAQIEWYHLHKVNDQETLSLLEDKLSALNVDLKLERRHIIQIKKDFLQKRGKKCQQIPTQEKTSRNKRKVVLKSESKQKEERKVQDKQEKNVKKSKAPQSIANVIRPKAIKNEMLIHDSFQIDKMSERRHSVVNKQKSEQESNGIDQNYDDDEIVDVRPKKNFKGDNQKQKQNDLKKNKGLSTEQQAQISDKITLQLQSKFKSLKFGIQSYQRDPEFERKMAVAQSIMKKR